MKYSFGISNFLEEISSLSHSIGFLYFFALTTEEGFLISPCYSMELCIQLGISFLFSFAFCFSSFHRYLWKESNPCPRSGAVAERSYPMFKVRSSGCTLLEQLWKKPHVQGNRNLSKRVGAERGHQGADRLKTQSQTTSESEHEPQAWLTQWN